MTDVDLVAKRLAFIETRLRELRELGDPSRIESDVREQRFTEHSLQLAIPPSFATSPNTPPTTSSPS